MLNLYITSTIKQEGKTFLTSGLATTMQSLGYTTSVYKPIQTSGIDVNGFTQSPDLTYIKSLDPYINTQFSYLFKTSAEPLIAAEEENEYIDLDLINKDYQKIISNSDCTLIDGDCGLLSPLAPSIQNIDIAKKLSVPILLTVKPNENAINSAILNINAAQEKEVNVRGVIINDIKNDTPTGLITAMTRVIEEYTGANILGLLPHIGGKVVAEDLITSVLNGIDIESVFDVKIEKLEFC